MRALTALAVAVAGLAAACSSEPPRYAFPVTFLAHADEPLAGVTISLDGRALGTTGPDGSLRVALGGREGAVVPFRVACPEGYRAPREVPPLTLRRFVGLDPQASARGIEVSIECAPAERVAALVVRTGQPGLPILAQGREVGRTGPAGVAHAQLRLPPNTTFRVVVDTRADPRLRPANPATTLTVPDGDEIFVIDQPLAIERPAAAPRPRPRPRRPPPERTGPERLK